MPLFSIRFRSLRDDDDGYSEAEHAFPTAMGAPVQTDLPDEEYKDLNDRYLRRAEEGAEQAEPQPA